MKTANTPQYQFTLDGLSAFLNIAEKTIREQSQQGRLNADDIDALHGNMQTALYNLGNALEMLGADRIDYLKTNDNPALCGGLLIAGGVMKAFASINDTLQSSRRHLTEPSSTAKPAKQGEWESC